MRSLTRSFPAIARIGLGVVFTVFGLNYFLRFVELPPYPGEALAFLSALDGSVYVLPIVKVVEIGAGVLLLSRRAVPLALVLLAPIVVNIVGFHLALAPQGTTLSIGVLAAEFYLAWVHRRAFLPLFGRTEPARDPLRAAEA